MSGLETGPTMNVMVFGAGGPRGVTRPLEEEYVGEASLDDPETPDSVKECLRALGDTAVVNYTLSYEGHLLRPAVDGDMSTWRYAKERGVAKLDESVGSHDLTVVIGVIPEGTLALRPVYERPVVKEEGMPWYTRVWRALQPPPPDVLNSTKIEAWRGSWVALSHVVFIAASTEKSVGFVDRIPVYEDIGVVQRRGKPTIDLTDPVSRKVYDSVRAPGDTSRLSSLRQRTDQGIYLPTVGKAVRVKLAELDIPQ